MAMKQTEQKRCAVYTRKSTDENLDSAFNSLDAQYDACSSYVRSQAGMGWTLVGKRYDDGGYSGGTMNRPALTELLKDIESGQIDIVVVYKIDRLSRSLCDFTDLFKTFERHGVSFVSVTQQIDTSNAAGRMMLNILMSFAQFEREMTADRIRDKIYASKKRGMWTGGPTPYGYVLEDKRLKVDPDAAKAVKMIFERYVATASSMQVARELNASNHMRPNGKEWRPGMVLVILKNRVYTGKIEVKRTGEVFEGQHEAIVGDALFDKAQELMAGNVKLPGKAKRHAIFAPLKGILRCGKCGGAMTPVFSNYSKKKRSKRRYVYYRCTTDAKLAEHACPIRNISAEVVEKFVYTRLAAILRRDDLRAMISRGNAEIDRAYLDETSDMTSFWSKMMPAERERLLRLLVKEVRLNPDRIEIDLTLDGDGNRIVVPVKMQSNLGRTVIVARANGEEREADPASAAIQTLRNSRRWTELLTSGTYADKKSLADALGLSAVYLGRVLRLASLSPRIVEKVMSGELNISVTQLMEITTPIWTEQHRQLGLPM